MLLAIVAIIAFQSYWLYKNFKEQQQTLQLRTNVLFRNAVYEVQIGKISDNDTQNIHIPAVAGPGTAPVKAAMAFAKKTPKKGKPDSVHIDPEKIKSVNVLRNGDIVIRTKDGATIATSVAPGDSNIDKRAVSTALLHMMAHPEAANGNFRSEDSGTIRVRGKISLNEVPRILLQRRDSNLVFANIDTTLEIKDSSGRIKRAGVVARATWRYDTSFKRTGVGIAARTSQATARILTNRTPGFNFVQILKSNELLKDTITIKELSDTLRIMMQKEKMVVPFMIARRPGEREHDDISTRRSQLQGDNEILVGYLYPFVYKIELQNTFGYILKKLYPQIIVSFLLVGLTILSFLLLLRNLVQQRKLTQLKNDFISNITHELKTPIATVSVAIEALKNFNALNDPKRTSEYLDISENELQRLSLLVDKVLRLSMFEKQQIELRHENFNLQKLVEEVVSSMRLQFEKYKAKINVRLEGENFTLKGDQLHITSVLFNLLDNALKYSKANPAIEVSLTEREQEFEMSVTDNGIGISPEYRKKIFDKFFRVPTGDTHNVKGYGLGLSYVAYVVQRHNGQMDVESQPGIGSRFTIKLPKNT